MAAGTAIPAFARMIRYHQPALHFESMPLQEFDHAQVRAIPKGKLATGEHYRSA
jgi:hypothetical protein